MMPPIAIGLIAVFAAIVVVALVAQSYVLERRQINRSLRNLDHWHVASTDVRAQELAATLPTRVIIPGIRRFGQFVRRHTPAGITERLAHRLELAGSPAGWDAERIMAFKVIGGAVGVLGVLAVGLLMDLSSIRITILVAGAGLLGYFLPDMQLSSVAQKRQEAIQRALPDSLDLLSITVEAGLGFDAALSRVSTQISGPLGEEYYRVIKEMQLGKSRADALRDLRDRTTVAELRSFVLAMIQADIFGLAIANVLQVQAGEMRIKRRQRAEEKAQKVPVKILFPLITCIFPSLFIVLLGPAAIRVYETLFNQ
jgi:tight adherence protein C